MVGQQYAGGSEDISVLSSEINIAMATESSAVNPGREGATPVPFELQKTTESRKHETSILSPKHKLFRQ
jgi:hypothetical protein